jgi:hypothetical protein
MKQQLFLSQEQFTNWLIALRSGEYNQGRVLLRTEDKEVGTCSHCCLGVLCEVSGFKFDDTCGYYFDEVTGRRSSHKFPTLDEKTENPLVIVTSDEQLEFVKKMQDKTGYRIGNQQLASINDSGKFTFSDIADIIEMFFEPSHL